MLRRFERNQVFTCALMAVAAALFLRFDVAAGVVGGGLLMAIGYGAIKSAADMLVPRGGAVPGRGANRQRAWTMAKFLGRYALLALGAYVMLVRLRMHPVGLLLGVSSPVLAAVVELVRMARVATRPGHSR